MRDVQLVAASPVHEQNKALCERQTEWNYLRTAWLKEHLLQLLKDLLV